MGNPTESVGDAVIALGKLLGLEIGEAGPCETVGTGDKEGSALDTGSNVEPPAGAVGIGDTLGC